MSAESREKEHDYHALLEESLKKCVPELVKKPAKPVDAGTALTLACRRKQVVD